MGSPLPHRWALAAVAAWLALWAVLLAANFQIGGWASWLAILTPSFLLGLLTGRWWTVLAPFALLALVPLAPEAEGPDAHLDEFSEIPAWVMVAGYLAPRLSLATLLGLVCRRWVFKRAAGRGRGA